jgi:hypothetical protein
MQRSLFAAHHAANLCSHIMAIVLHQAANVGGYIFKKEKNNIFL